MNAEPLSTHLKAVSGIVEAFAKENFVGNMTSGMDKYSIALLTST